MKNLLALLIICFSITLSAQEKNTVITESEYILLKQNNKTKKYKLHIKQTGKKYKNLKFAKQINAYYQVLTKNNQLFYVNKKGTIKNNVEDIFYVCGTVPEYVLSIKETQNHFEIYRDEIFFDSKNKFPPEKINTISKEIADKVLFINGKNDFNYSGNFSVGITSTNPEMLILIKNGKYTTANNPNIYYDELDFSNFYNYIKTKRNNCYGILEVSPPKYKKIEDFTYYLAKAETIEGKTVYIDIDGNEY